MHRHVHRVLGSVYAFKSEIDAWQREQREQGPSPPHRDRVRRRRCRDADAVDRGAVVRQPERRSGKRVSSPTASPMRSPPTSVALRSLRVISRTSSGTFKGSTKDAKTISRELRRAIPARGKRSPDERPDCASPPNSSTRTPTRTCGRRSSTAQSRIVFAIQERIARVIVNALQLQLSTDEDRRLAERRIDNIHAYECYLRARQQGWRWRKDAIDQAIQLLRNGLDIVGDNARLYAALGVAYLQYREAGIDFGEQPIVEAESCARKVFELEQSSADRTAAARMDPLFARANPGGRSRSRIGARPGAERRRHAVAAQQLLSHLRAASRRRVRLIERLVGDRSADSVDALHAGVGGNTRGRFRRGRRAVPADVRDGSRQPDDAIVLRLGAAPQWAIGELAAVASGRFPVEVRDTVPARLAFFLAASLIANTMVCPFSRRSSTRWRRRRTRATCSRECSPAATRGPATPTTPCAGSRSPSTAASSTIRFSRASIPSLDNLRGERRFQQLMGVVRERWERFEV